MAGITTLAKRASLGGIAVLAGELLWAIARPVPSFVDLDATGREGDPAGVPLRMAVLGDSSCTGPGLDDPADIWIRDLARHIGDRFYVDVRSFAIGGSRAGDVVRSQLPAALAWQPDIAFVSIGANDALKGSSLGAFRRNLETITVELATVAELVVLSGVGDLGSIPRLAPPLDRLYRLRGRALDAIHREIAGTHDVLVADQWEWAAEVFSTRPDIFSPDLFHPGVQGHRVWAQVALETIDPHLTRFIDRSDADRIR